MSYGKAVREELRRPARELRHAIPQVYAGYRQLHDSALGAGALDVRTKELISLAIAVSKECDGCIAAHAHAAVLHGATPPQAAEAIGVTFLMNGGPGHRLRRAGVRRVPGVLCRAGRAARQALARRPVTGAAASPPTAPSWPGYPRPSPRHDRGVLVLMACWPRWCSRLAERS
jgi:AhpD family alkylhydroperoxidase